MVAKNEEMKVKQERKSYRNKEIKPGDGEAGYGIEGKGTGERRRRVKVISESFVLNFLTADHRSPGFTDTGTKFASESIR